MSICSIEDVAAHTKAPFWFQLYVMRDRDFIERLIDRAKAARCGALVLTVDLQILGQRHKDLKNGLSAPPKLTLANIVNMMTKPRWCLGMLGTRRRRLRQRRRPREGRRATWARSRSGRHKQLDPRLSWGDVEWIKKRWGGKLILKGIQDVEDAKLAAESGADALIVSNHGGRQLDGAESSIRALPAIVDAVGSRIEVHMDGGIRSGQDVLKAVALGARGTTSAARSSTASARWARPASRRRWRSSTASSTSRWRSAGAPGSRRWTRASCCRRLTRSARSQSYPVESRRLNHDGPRNYPRPVDVIGMPTRLGEAVTSRRHTPS